MKCIICNKPLDYYPEYCCNGQDCGCRGKPIHPPTCDDKCTKACLDYIGISMDDRRKKAGINLYKPTDN